MSLQAEIDLAIQEAQAAIARLESVRAQLFVMQGVPMSLAQAQETRTLKLVPDRVLTHAACESLCRNCDDIGPEAA